MIAMAYKVTAPLVIVRDNTGTMHHVYENGLLPDNADKKHVEQLLDSGMVEKAKAAPAPPTEDAQPAGNADRATWAAWAEKKGATADELKDQADGGLSRDDLRAKYGS